jgi:hypothetical protein
MMVADPFRAARARATANVASTFFFEGFWQE